MPREVPSLTLDDVYAGVQGSQKWIDHWIGTDLRVVVRVAVGVVRQPR